MDQAAQNNAQNAQNANGDEEMEVVPPHLDPLNQGAIIANLQFQLNQMRLEIDRGRNQHLLGVMDNAPDVPGVPVDEAPLPVITQDERHRIEGLQRIMRTAPKFHGSSQEPWRSFELRFTMWRAITRLDTYATQNDRKMILLSSLEGAASSALELHGKTVPRLDRARHLRSI